MPETGDFHENNLHEVVRQVAGDLVEEVRLVDKFSPPGGGRSSACYRITFRQFIPERNVLSSHR
jgi:phenylalanyl-tRNA synthetase alpha chain